MARNKKIIIIATITADIVILARAPWLDNQSLHDKVFEERAKTDGTIDKDGNLICDYNVMWIPFGRYIASCEGGYFATFWGKILFPEPSLMTKKDKDERCLWKITREHLEKLGLHCSAIAGYYYGPAIVGMPSDEYACNPVPGCEYDSEIVPFKTYEECKSVCERM